MYTVDQAEIDLGLNRGQVIAMFKEIARNGVATFKIGRKGWPTRLVRK